MYAGEFLLFVGRFAFTGVSVNHSVQEKKAVELQVRESDDDSYVWSDQQNSPRTINTESSEKADTFGRLFVFLVHLLVARAATKSPT